MLRTKTDNEEKHNNESQIDNKSQIGYRRGNAGFNDRASDQSGIEEEEVPLLNVI